MEYDLRKRHLLNRESKIASLTTCHDNSELDLATITDAKSLYDNLMQEQYTGPQKRAALEICVIRDSLESLGGRARWVPHDRNPAWKSIPVQLDEDQVASSTSIQPRFGLSDT